MYNTQEYGSPYDHGHQHRATFNINAHFIGPNPSTSFNSKSVYPTLDPTVYVGPFSSVIGDVTIKRNVFIAPCVSIRADEGFPFYIGSETNLQDGIILHGLHQGRVVQDGVHYSIYIGEHVSCAHRALIHGPCKIGDHSFIGFNVIIFRAIIGAGCYISANALVTGGVKIPSNRFVPSGAIIDTQQKADRLGPVPRSDTEFAKDVQRINHEFPRAYTLMFGETKCSCGLACDSHETMDLLD